MFQINPILAIDSYKLGHMTMYPEGTTKVYCNITPRSSKRLQDTMPKGFYDGKIVVFGVSAAIQEIAESFDSHFFKRDKQDMLDEFAEFAQSFVGDNDLTQLLNNIGKLHDLGYLPLVIKSMPEGTRINAGIPMMTITNTHPDFAWLPNYLETFISSQLWKLSTAATIANVYKGIFKHFAQLTGVDEAFTWFQGHDFSSRGMSGVADAVRTGSAHLTSFMGSDAVSSAMYAKHYYCADGFIAGSVPATEHSVMCMGSQEGEVDTFRRVFNQYPKGIVSIVSDTWDYWNTITNIAAELKPEIMAREKDSIGFCKTVFRPDSGNPVDVIVGTDNVRKFTNIESLDDWLYQSEENDGECFEFENKFYEISGFSEFLREYGYEATEMSFYGQIESRQRTINEYYFNRSTPEAKGSVQCLWDTFGGTETTKGYKVLDEHVGLIYGDSITPQRAVDILQGLADKGFASSNIVLGIGSYTYQYMTRDTLGFAMKATYAEINGEGVQIFKAPKTDSGKNSAKGMLRVDYVNNEYVLVDSLTDDDGGCLNVLFKDGMFYNIPTLEVIRGRLN